MKIIGRLFLILLPSAYFVYCANTPAQWHFIDMVDLIFHEAGHSIFMFFGEFIYVLMGSGFQVLLPLLIALYFFYTHQRISGGVTLMWTGQSLINVSVYAADAIAMQLPLLGGDSSGHDWRYLLSTTHLLRYTPQISYGIYALGVLTILAGIGLAVYYAIKSE